MIPTTRRPSANDIATPPVIAVTAFAQDERGRVLVQRAADGRWILPGGARAPGEALGQAVVRILAEATGTTFEILGLVGIYNETHRVTDRPGGPCRQVSVCLRARPPGGNSVLGPDLRWAARDELDALGMRDSTLLRIGHGFDERSLPHIEARPPRPRPLWRFPWPRRPQ